MPITAGGNLIELNLTSIVAVAESGLPPCASMCAAWTFGNAGIGPRVPKVSCKVAKFAE